MVGVLFDFSTQRIYKMDMIAKAGRMGEIGLFPNNLVDLLFQSIYVCHIHYLGGRR